MAEQKNIVVVVELPKCSFCSKIADYDGRTRFGSWAYMCTLCFLMFGVGLGLGKGQELMVQKGGDYE